MTPMNKSVQCLEWYMPARCRGVPAASTAVVTTVGALKMNTRDEASYSACCRLMRSAPKGLRFSSEDDVGKHAATIDRQFVQSRTMPPIWNISGITDADRSDNVNGLKAFHDCRSDRSGGVPCNGDFSGMLR